MRRERIGLSVGFGKRLEIKGAFTDDQDPEQRHEQQEPLRLAHSRAVAAKGNRVEEADQPFRYDWNACGRAGFGRWAGEIPLTKANADTPPRPWRQESNIYLHSKNLLSNFTCIEDT